MSKTIRANGPKRLPFDARKVIYKSRMIMRRKTARFRLLPNFIIIGAMKAGTTSLFEYLSQHPHVLRSRLKEVFFFNKHYPKGVRWYQEHFPLRMKKWIYPNLITGEATPTYLFDPMAPKRIHELVPAVKLIVLLRNPTERCISEYFHHVRKGRETRSIMSALNAEHENDLQTLQQNTDSHPNHINFDYLGKSRYKEQLERYFQVFPREQNLVINSESFFNAPKETLKKVFQFLGIEQYDIPDLSPKHVATNRTKVEPEIYDYLDNYFASHNRELYQLLGINFDW